MNELISIIVPVYNVEKWLDECMESLIRQTYKNLEIILVDDGSKDNSSLMCDEWAKKDERIKVVHKENGGLSSARNAGLDVCTGDYIGFVDSDDYIDERMFEILLNDIKQYDVDIAKCKMYMYYENDKSIEYNEMLEDKKYNREELLDCFFYHKDEMAGGMCDKLFDSKFFEKLRFPVGLNTEDYYVCANIYSESRGMYSNKTPMYCYRQRDDSICRKKIVDEHSYDEIKISDKVNEMVTNKYPGRIKDAKAFCAIARFSVYNLLLYREHEKELEKEWQKDLQKYVDEVMNNSKFGISFKLKYYVFSYHMSKYLLIKKIVGKYGLK